MEELYESDSNSDPSSDNEEDHEKIIKQCSEETEVNKFDFTPRDYQDELLGIAIEENTILYLSTGSGKTFIAIQLIKSFSGYIEKPFSNGSKRAFFLVNTVALVSQQSEAIRRHSKFSVGAYSGDMNVDLWSKDKWLGELEEYHVMVMTAQILLNLLQHGYITLDRIKVIVFDECHRAVGDHPMRNIMRFFENVEDQPRVLGLTGSLLNGTIKTSQVKDYIRELESTFLARIITAKDDTMAHKIDCFSADPDVELVYFNTKCYREQPYDKCMEKLKKLKELVRKVNLDVVDFHNSPSKPYPNSIEIHDKKKSNKKLENLIVDVENQIKEHGLYAGYSAALSQIIKLERLKRNSQQLELSLVYQSMITALTVIRKYISDLMDKFSNQGEQILKFSSNKVIMLIDILKSIKSDDKVIIFVQRRFTSKIIYYIIKDLHAGNYLPHIKADFMVGFNNNPFNDSREGLFEKKINKEVLQKFHTDELNVIVSSDVLEEGIDIQAVNVVIRYDPPMTARSFIQSKGRARCKNSVYYLFIEGNKQSGFNENSYNKYKDLESCLKKELIGKSLDRTVPSEEEVDQSLYNCCIQSYSPFGPHGPKITETSVIPLINRYCLSLCTDRYSRVGVKLWKNVKIIKGVTHYVVTLELPPASPLRLTISSEPFRSLDLAKRSAAMAACIKLHQNKELDDNLLPRGRQSELLTDPLICPNWEFDVVDKNETKSGTGTKGNKQLYTIKYPEILTGVRPIEGEPVYISIVKFKPLYEFPKESARKAEFYHLFLSDQTFGILTTKRLHKVAEFPLFISSGEIRITITANLAQVTLTEEEISYLVNFHSMIFTEMIRVTQSFVYRDNSNTKDSYLYAPVKEDDSGKYILDWNVIKTNQNIPSVEPLTIEERKNLKVTEELYTKSVVVPWYRGFSSNQVYIVTAISEEEDAYAPFPSDEFDDYIDYFTQKYSTNIGETVYSPTEMLLEVRAVSRSLNCLKPRSNKRANKRIRREEEEFEETLVAELCVRFNLPGVYWLKATLLPCISHRLHYLMLAEELRLKLMSYLLEKNVLVDDSLVKAVELDPMSMCEMEYCENKMSATNPRTITIKPKANLLIDNVYPWGDEQEPIDFERHPEDVRLLDIYFYDDFINKPLNSEKVYPLNNPIVLNERKNNEVLTFKPNDPAPSLFIFQKMKTSCIINVQQADLLVALTCASSHDIFNYERLETLGDSFLKFSITLILFINYPQLTEGQLTNVKGKIIGNRNLFYCGKKHELGSTIKVNEFNTDCDWIPPGFCVDLELQETLRTLDINPRFLYSLYLSKEEVNNGELSLKSRNEFAKKIKECQESETNDLASMRNNAAFVSQQLVNDKAISDTIEAILGLYVKNCGLEAGFKLLTFMGITKPELITADIIHKCPIKSPCIGTEKDVNFHLHKVDHLESIIGYKFKDRSFLLQALSHPTFQPNNITPTYQRLEFLGDAILDFLITAHIFEKCSSKLMPGELTDLRSALVNNVTLATISVRMGLHKFLLLRCYKLNEIIDAFVERQAQRNHAIDDQVLFLIEEENISLGEAVEVPKVLGDLFESMVAAIYLDSDKCLETTWNFIYNFMKDEISNFSQNVPKNFVRQLYEENVYTKFRRCHILEEMGRVMVPVSISFNNETKTFYGFGETKNHAKRAAAKLALRHIRQ